MLVCISMDFTPLLIVTKQHFLFVQLNVLVCSGIHTSHSILSFVPYCLFLFYSFVFLVTSFDEQLCVSFSSVHHAKFVERNLVDVKRTHEKK